MKTTNKLEKEIKDYAKRINSKLESNPLLAPAVSFAEYAIRKLYTNDDWFAYEKETGYERPVINPPKNGLEAAIDKATGYDLIQNLNFLKFLLWCIDNFELGMKEGLTELRKGAK